MTVLSARIHRLVIAGKVFPIRDFSYLSLQVPIEIFMHTYGVEGSCHIVILVGKQELLVNTVEIVNEYSRKSPFFKGEE